MRSRRSVVGRIRGALRRRPSRREEEAALEAVQDAYRRFLQREPAETELVHWRGVIDGGSSSSAMLESIVSSEEATRLRNETTRRRTRLVWLAFEVARWRVPSDAELSHWAARFDEGLMPWDVIASLVGGEERPVAPEEREEAVRGVVLAAYRRFLYREPSEDDLSAWVAAVDAGTSPWEVLASVASSEEACTDTFLDELSNAELVAYALEPLYGRGLSPAELARWKHSLDSGSVGRAGFLLQAMVSHVRDAAARRDAAVSGSDPQEVTIMGTAEVLSPAIWRARAQEIADEDAADGDAAASGPARQVTAPYVVTGEPKVSVITSLYGGGAYIERFLDMITSQTMGTDVELIIIDAQSPDGEASTIERYQASHPNIVYRRTDHRIGIYQAWNIGIGLARAAYLTNANLDDLRAPDSLQQQAEVLDRYPWVDVVYQDFFYTLDDTLDFDAVARFGFVSDLPIVTPGNLMRYNSPHNAPMWRTSLHAEVGLFDEFLRSAGDYEFWMRCAAADATFFKINRPHVAYFQNPTGMSTKPGGPGAEEAIRALRTHAPALVSPLVFTDDSAFRSELESLCGFGLDVSGPTTFYDLAQHALESCWRADSPTGGDQS